MYFNKNRRLLIAKINSDFLSESLNESKEDTQKFVDWFM